MEGSIVATSGITTRYRFEWNDTNHYGWPNISTAAHIARPEKSIICIPTQIGCPVQCRFCSAYGIGFIRNLTVQEMGYMLGYIHGTRGKEYESLLISFMGTGEPALNVEAINAVTKSVWGELAKFALATSGLGMERILKVNPIVKVTFSLLSWNPAVRAALYPNYRRLTSGGEWAGIVAKYSGPKEINVPLIDGVNDNPLVDMPRIAELARNLGIPVKLSHFNSLNGFNPSELSAQCLQALKDEGIQAEYYETDGAEINAACGQFELPNR